MAGKLQRIIPCLWFHDQAEEAVAFYTSVFADSRVDVTYYDAESAKVAGRPEGSEMTISLIWTGSVSPP